MSVDYKITKSMSDTQKMVRFSRWEKHRAEQGIVWSDWVRSIAENHYKGKRQRVTAANEFKEYMEELVEYITDEKRGEDKLDNFKLTGQNPVSAAYRKLHGGLKNGFDITNHEQYSSVNSIAEASKEEKKRLDKIEEEKSLDEELHYAVEEAGFEPGTAEHDVEFDRIKNENGMTLIQGGLSEENEPDHIDEILVLLEEKLRAMERAGYGDQDLDNKVNAVIGQWDNYIASAVKAASIAAAS